MSFLFREIRRHGTDEQTDGQTDRLGVTLNAAPFREGCIVISGTWVCVCSIPC